MSESGEGRRDFGKELEQWMAIVRKILSIVDSALKTVGRDYGLTPKDVQPLFELVEYQLGSRTEGYSLLELKRDASNVLALNTMLELGPRLRDKEKIGEFNEDVRKLIEVEFAKLTK